MKPIVHLVRVQVREGLRAYERTEFRFPFDSPAAKRVHGACHVPHRTGIVSTGLNGLGGDFPLDRDSRQTRAVCLNLRVERNCPCWASTSHCLFGFVARPFRLSSVRVSRVKFPAPEVNGLNGMWVASHLLQARKTRSAKCCASSTHFDRGRVGQCAASFPENVLLRKAGLSIYFDRCTSPTGTVQEPAVQTSSVQYKYLIVMNINTHHACKKCSQFHPLNYFLFMDGTRHLFYQCTSTKQRFFVPYRPGLNIPEVKSSKIVKEERKQLQPTLF